MIEAPDERKGQIDATCAFASRALHVLISSAIFDARARAGLRCQSKKAIGGLLQIAPGYRCREQSLTLGATNLYAPAQPLSVNLDAQFESDEPRQLECPFSHTKLTHPNMRVRVLRVGEGKTVFCHKELDADHLTNTTATRICLMLGYANNYIWRRFVHEIGIEPIRRRSRQALITSISQRLDNHLLSAK
jgi:hypothetical protein